MEPREAFRDPPSEFRGKPFWSWNGKLEEAELRRQIRVFREMGFGGAFMHSRVGLATPYLSEEWFRLVRACVDECRGLGMEAWAYDEDRWPSGAAGGLVTREARFRARAVVAAVVEPGAKPPDGCLALFVARAGERGVSGVRRAKPGEAPGKDERLLAFRVDVAGESPWYNDQTYLDTLSPAAVRRFIEVTHEAYAREAGASFGPALPGIFTDEPNYAGAGGAPWTEDLPAVFRKRHGYDLLDRLPELFYGVDGEAFSKVRRDYRETITHLFTTSFAKQIGEWCGKHGIAFTGHVLAEENLASQTSVVGAAMPFYEWMQAPGIDILCGQGLERAGGRPPEYLTAKQCASALRQFGRKWMLSELYGCTGWQFTLREHKAVGDWQAALGVTLRCPHLSPYTLLGEAKRDYPAAISFQSPWWKHYRLVEDYFSRVNVWLTRGEPVRDVAVVHPIESAWGLIPGGEGGAAASVQSGVDRVESALLSGHVDFDWIDESLLAVHGGVDGRELAMGRARYRAVVVPPMVTVRRTTLELLARFLDAGGFLVFAGAPPGLVDGGKSDAAAKLAGTARLLPEGADPAPVLAGVPGIRRVRVADAGGAEAARVLYQMRREPESGRTIVLLCNTRQSAGTGPVTVRIPASGQVQEWDPATGRVSLADARSDGEGVAVATELHPYGSRLFVVDPAPDPALAQRPASGEVRTVPVSPGPWPVTLDEPNAMPLDRPAYSIDGGEFRPETEILFVDRTVRDAAGLRHRGGAMVQPWAAVPPKDMKRVKVRLRYRFEVEAVPAGPVHVVMEQPERFTVELNGKAVGTRDDGSWIDPAFRRLPVPGGALKAGANELVMETAYAHDSGLEAVYLTGDFGARWHEKRAVITAPPRKLSPGDWREQGLPCYSGSVTYEMEAEAEPDAQERVAIVLPSWEGTVALVSVNGGPAGACPWPPYEVDVTGALKPGRNRIAVTVVSSRRNLLGPLHNSEVYPAWTGPWEFVDTKRWTDEYVGVPYGLMSPPVISIRR